MGHLSRRRSHAYEPLSLKRRAWLTLGAVVAGGAGMVSYAVAGPGHGTSTFDAGAERPTEVHALKLTGADDGRRTLTRTATRPFSLLGVSWTGAATELDGTTQVRTRSEATGEWTAWRALATPATARSGAERGTSEPLWVGLSDGVEARVLAADGSSTAGLPKGLEVDLVDPGVTAEESRSWGSGDGTAGTARSAGTADASGAMSNAAFVVEDPPTALPSTVTRPPIVSRARWGADESTVTGTAAYIDKISAVFVHHTGGTDTYSCAESPALIRALMAYDIETAGRGDLGYNFVVDKCGRVYEGRAGGADLSVRGDHTPGFDGDSTGVAVLGDFRSGGGPSRAALESVARLAAWKLGQYAGDPTGKVTLTASEDTGVYAQGESAELDVISGGRDAATTTSPGTSLYDKLPEIRRYAASPGRNSAIPTADYTGDGVSDLVAPTHRTGSGWITLVPGGVNGPVAAAKLRLDQASTGVPGAAESGDQWGAATSWGDINGDGYADLAVGAPGEDDTTGHADRGAVTILYGPSFTTDADTMALGDDYEPSGARFGATVTVGDFNADGKADVFTAATGTGGNWAARFNDGHEVAGDLTTATGALAYADAATGDFNRDGYADVALNYRDASGVGKVTWFRGSKSLGLTKVSTLTVRGGRAIAAGDVNGNGYDDIVIGQPYASESGGNAGGQVTLVPGTSTGFTTTGMTTIHQGTANVEGASETSDGFGSAVSIGDANADGYADVLTGAPNEDITRAEKNRANAGSAWLLKGTATGLTGTGSLALSQDTPDIPGSTETDDKFGSAASLTDVTGDGCADLVTGAEGEDTGNGTILYVPSVNGTPSPTKSAYYGIAQLGTSTAGRLGQVLTP
ncbi:FG-GAP-like repeat-containing protein [Streptomyces sp. DSM 40750]|uniref:FG-GAP-like repeat-containing protein n=1 Tax=Streptomyces sp. DSM 40750 TaxID=2801030 RepID=UPI00214B6C18|nr:FG-GAP-like repeat-containing protein [Streptomyces sp. DSM 40750]UUU24535.1 FG-GAP-like repeat-containing protein [Streptomyces sp. DSM 40750]